MGRVSDVRTKNQWRRECYFLSVRGAAGMYRTDESPAPVCSASTAWIRSQCPGVSTLAAGILDERPDVQ
jgi:hypothetical protein